jgi:glucose-6-phosphate isomerase
MPLVEPYATSLNFQNGTLAPVHNIIKRHLSDMRRMYADAAAVEDILRSEGDRLIYEVYMVAGQEEEGHLLQCTTIIHPGQVGQEYHMTKGHFHARRDRAEVYVGLGGQGQLLLQTDEKEFRNLAMQPGTVAYIPPWWAHRTVNTGSEPFAFLSVWPGDAGHDYGTIESSGFAHLVVEYEGQMMLVDNPG